MYRNNSKGKPYYTQRNNKIKPGSSCNVTSMVAALSAAGWPVEKMASGGRQPEDELMRFILTDASCDRKWRMLDPQGKIPPNEWHAVLAYGTNRWLLGLGYPGFGSKPGIVSWREGATLHEIQEQVNKGGAAVVSGRFPHQGSQIDHVVAVVGTDGDGLIIDDPWGDWHDGYTTTKGDDIALRHSEAVQMLKPLGGVKKWAHLVRPYISPADSGAEIKEALI